VSPHSALLTALAGSVLCLGLPAQMPLPHYCTRVQEPAGNWSAVSGGGRVDAGLRVTALMLLAQLGSGTTLARREGYFRSLEGGVQWLRQQQDTKGRIALHTGPDWPLDHAMATCVLAEVLRTGGRAPPAEEVVAAVDALRTQLAAMRPCPGAEMRLWCDMIVRSLRQAVAIHEAKLGERAKSVATAAEQLAACVAALPATAAQSPRQEAAQFLRVALAEGDGAAMGKAWLDDPLRDPLTSFYGYTALYLRGGNDWAEASKRITSVVARQLKEGEHKGSWEPVGEFGTENGRHGTTAAAILLLQVYYRSSRLEICQ
jgi:hypothetical protein